MQRTTTGLVCAALCACLTAHAAPFKPFEMDVVETHDLRLLYQDPFQTYLVPHTIRNFENSMAFQEKLYGWKPSEKVNIILTDFSDYNNAGASASPFDGVSVYIAPASRTLETMPSSERMFMLMNHELTHVANMDMANSTDLKWRHFFGGKPRQVDEHPESILYNYLATPRLSVPRWYLEGAAVFMETWMSGGIGRAQGGYDEMVFRAMVRDDAHFYSNLGIVSEGVSVDFQTGANAYLYGTRFISYLAYIYSPQKLIEWLRRGEDSERYYAKQFEHVYGKPIEAAWDDWIAWEHEFQEANLARVRQRPLTPVKHLVDTALGSISRSYYDPKTNSMVGAFRYPGVVAHVGMLSLDTGKVRRITDIKGPMKYRVSSTAWDPATRTFFYTADNVAWRDLMEVNVDTGKRRMLIKDGRIGDLVFNPNDRTIWGLRHLNGYVSLVRIPPPYTEWHLVHAWPYGEVAYELDLSPDGKLLSTSLGEIDGSQYLRVFRTEDLLNGKAESIRSFDFSPAVPEGFVFSPDGRYLYGSSFYTGVSNIIRFDIESGDIEAVSNAETGFFRPLPLEDGRMLVFEFTGQGFVPSIIDPVPVDNPSSIDFLGNEIARKYPVIRDWNVVGTLRDVDEEKLITRRAKYRPYRELEYSSGYPVLLGYRDDLALGWNFHWQDPAQLHDFQITAGYSWDSPSDEAVHFNAEYHALYWYGKYWHNYADFYDLFGPTKRARKGDAVILGYEKALIYDTPRELDFYSEMGWYTGIDTLPDNQNVSTFLIEDLLTFKAGLEYADTRKSLGAVDDEKGWRWNVETRVDHSKFDTIPKLRAGVDLGFALPWKHSSVWLYAAAGAADGNRLDPLTNFYFGGFGNNYVDNGEIKRYREYYSMPGFEIDAISAREFGRLMLEWNLPPIRFREVGTPSFFLKDIRPALFGATLKTDPGKIYQRTTSSLGFQLDLEFTVVHRLPMTLSLGWGVGYEDGDKHDDEWMLSLKIL